MKKQNKTKKSQDKTLKKTKKQNHPRTLAHSF